MGIPSYFSYLVKNHPTTIKCFKQSNIIPQNLYLDCNSIIYDAYNKMTHFSDISIIKSVIQQIDVYIQTVKPSKTVIIAFDGVAPVAKLEQQRSRRYKTWFQNEYFQKKTHWNTSAITPGTDFMNSLNNRIEQYYKNNSNIIVSGSNIPGEGEHKLFQYIRDNPLKHSCETTFIYGLDADLIMLSINHLPLCPSIYLFRETPHFIQSIDKSLKPNENYVLDIRELSISINGYMNQDFNSKYDVQKVYDYILVCFLLGNDFMPHFPALNIRTGGIEKIMNAYKETIQNDEYISDGSTISWNHFRKIILYLANNENEYLCNEHELRTNKEKISLPDSTPDDKIKRFELLPTYNREIEKYINPFKPYWQSRYYRSLFGKDYCIRDICINYLEGIEWTTKYYSTGCIDWRWKYKYCYPPLLQDLIQYIPLYNHCFLKKQEPNPVSDIVQLCYVLPRNSLNLLPVSIYSKLTMIKEFNNWYKLENDFVWAYCRYFWESHVEMEEIDIAKLESLLNTN
jgi:5'-3' exoribonuclease 1